MKGLAPIGTTHHVNFVGMDVKRHVAHLKANFVAKGSHLRMKQLKRIMFANTQRNAGWLGSQSMVPKDRFLIFYSPPPP